MCSLGTLCTVGHPIRQLLPHRTRKIPQITHECHGGAAPAIGTAKPERPCPDLGQAGPLISSRTRWGRSGWLRRRSSPRRSAGCQTSRPPGSSRLSGAPLGLSVLSVGVGAPERCIHDPRWRVVGARGRVNGRLSVRSPTTVVRSARWLSTPGTSDCRPRTADRR